MPSSLVDLISSAHIGNQSGGFEPQRVNSIILVIPGLGQDGDEISLALQSFTIPPILGNTNPVMIQRGLIAKKFAGNVTFDVLTIDFKQYVDRPTLEALVKWRQRVYNPVTKQINAAAVYKRDAEIIFIPPAGSGGQQQSIITKGLFPLSINQGNADLASDDTLNINCPFEYDECLPGQGFDTTSLALSAGITFSAGGSGFGASVSVGAGGISANAGFNTGVGGVNVGFQGSF